MSMNVSGKPGEAQFVPLALPTDFDYLCLLGSWSETQRSCCTLNLEHHRRSFDHEDKTPGERGKSDCPERPSGQVVFFIHTVVISRIFMQKKRLQDR